jgi:hypothetical protein
VPTPLGADFDSTWKKLASQPASTIRDEAQANALAELATHTPEHAIATALAEPNSYLRQLLLSAALRGWASHEPDAAANWSLQRPLGERGADIRAVLESAAADPTVALRITAQLVSNDSTLAHDYGCSLVYALAQRGDFASAAMFAAQGSADHREAWLATAFAVWTEHQPQTAAAAALAQPDEIDRKTASQAVMDRWATLDPLSLANFALRLPRDSNRSYAISAALAEWTNQDLPAASAWLNQLEPSAELDAGVAAVATRQPLVARRPETAVNWAESVFDPTLRSQTLTAIVREWAKADHPAAQHYAETSPAIIAADRSSLLTDLNPPAEQ